MSVSNLSLAREVDARTTRAGILSRNCISPITENVEVIRKVVTPSMTRVSPSGIDSMHNPTITKRLNDAAKLSRQEQRADKSFSLPPFEEGATPGRDGSCMPLTRTDNGRSTDRAEVCFTSYQLNAGHHDFRS